MAFGLDLVGGMSVTLEVSTPEFVKSQVKNQNDIAFTSPYEKALKKYNSNSSLDFIDVFVSEFRKENDNLQLNTIFTERILKSQQAMMLSLNISET